MDESTQQLVNAFEDEVMRIMNLLIAKFDGLNKKELFLLKYYKKILYEYVTKKSWPEFIYKDDCLDEVDTTAFVTAVACAYLLLLPNGARITVNAPSEYDSKMFNIRVQHLTTGKGIVNFTSLNNDNFIWTKLDYSRISVTHLNPFSEFDMVPGQLSLQLEKPIIARSFGFD